MTKYIIYFTISKGEKIPLASEETVLEKRCECPELGIVNLLPGRIVVYDTSRSCDGGVRMNIEKIKIDVVCPAFMTISAIDSDNVTLRARGVGNAIVVPIGQLESLEGGFYDPDAWYAWREARHQNDKNVLEQMVLWGRDAAFLTDILSGRRKIITPEQAKELGID